MVNGYPFPKILIFEISFIKNTSIDKIKVRKNKKYQFNNNKRKNNNQRSRI